MDEYFSDSTEIDSLVYLKLAHMIIKSMDKEIITIAEDVSGMPGLATSVWDGGIGFDYRLNMAIPDFWIRYLKDVRDEKWNVQEMGNVYLNVRHDERVISYCESHDQAIVGDKTIAHWLFDGEIYTHMSKLQGPKTLKGARAIGLHKMIRLLTLMLGDGFLAFIGNDFGHPEWVDFPREQNGGSFERCRRQWSLSDNPDLYYFDLRQFDQEMIELDRRFNFREKWRTMFADYNQGDRVVSFDGHGIFVVFNFNTTSVG
jgi:1,4-alpha-glucan branching enzyme